MKNLSHKRSMICLKNVLREAESGTDPNSPGLFYSVLSTGPQNSYLLLIILHFLIFKVLPKPSFSINTARITFLATSPTVLIYVSCEGSN